MTTITKIWTGTASTDTINKSTAFTNADFLIIEDFLPVNEGYELAASVVIKIGFDFLEREIPLWICEPFLDTKAVIPLPKEVTQSEYDCYFNFLVSQGINLDVYAVSLDITLRDLQLDLEDIINYLVDISNKIDIVQNTLNVITLETSLIATNQIIQNQALVIVGTGLAPITGGVSLGAIPLLESGATLLLPAL